MPEQGNPLQAELDASERSFSNATASSNAAAGGKKGKRDPSPLSRMLAPLTRSFSKLRTSRSKSKDSRLQTQSRTASQSDSLASRGTSASTQGTSMPGRFNSLPYQQQTAGMHLHDASALRASDSFQFNTVSAKPAVTPELLDEPSFAQDLSLPKAPHSSIAAPGQFLIPSSTSGASPAKTGAAISTNQAPAQVSASAESASDDDEFAYDLDDTGAFPTASRHSNAPTLATQPVAHTADPVSKHGADSSSTDKTAAEGKHEAGVLVTAQSVSARDFRPQRSRADIAPLSLPAASIYAPLQSGAATSPTMQGSVANARDASEAFVDDGGVADRAVHAPDQQHVQQRLAGQSKSVASVDLISSDVSRDSEATGLHQTVKEGAAEQHGSRGKEPRLQESVRQSQPQAQQVQHAQQQGSHVVGSLHAEASDADTSQSSAASSPRSPTADIDQELQQSTSQDASGQQIKQAAGSARSQAAVGVSTVTVSEDSFSSRASPADRKALQGAWPASPRQGFSDKPILGQGTDQASASTGSMAKGGIASSSTSGVEKASAEPLQQKVNSCAT